MTDGRQKETMSIGISFMSHKTICSENRLQISAGHRGDKKEFFKAFSDRWRFELISSALMFIVPPTVESSGSNDIS